MIARTLSVEGPSSSSVASALFENLSETLGDEVSTRLWQEVCARFQDAAEEAAMRAEWDEDDEVPLPTEEARQKHRKLQLDQNDQPSSSGERVEKAVMGIVDESDGDDGGEDETGVPAGIFRVLGQRMRQRSTSEQADPESDVSRAMLERAQRRKQKQQQSQQPSSASDKNESARTNVAATISQLITARAGRLSDAELDVQLSTHSQHKVSSAEAAAAHRQHAVVRVPRRSITRSSPPPPPPPPPPCSCCAAAADASGVVAYLCSNCASWLEQLAALAESQQRVQRQAQRELESAQALIQTRAEQLERDQLKWQTECVRQQNELLQAQTRLEQAQV